MANKANMANTGNMANMGNTANMASMDNMDDMDDSSNVKKCQQLSWFLSPRIEFFLKVFINRDLSYTYLY